MCQILKPSLPNHHILRVLLQIFLKVYKKHLSNLVPLLNEYEYSFLFSLFGSEFKIVHGQQLHHI